MAQRIYLIEDDTALRTELAHVLELSGYAVAAYEGTWGDTAARALAAEPDCIVLDLKLPGADGHSICRDIRGKSSVPILMLTSSESEFDEVMAMNLGADDYVTKPYRPAVLLAHLQALLRRSASPAAGMTILHKGVTLNMGAGTVEFKDAPPNSRATSCASYRRSCVTPAWWCPAARSCVPCGNPTPSSTTTR